jgi:hypothetical protein
MSKRQSHVENSTEGAGTLYTVHAHRIVISLVRGPDVHFSVASISSDAGVGALYLWIECVGE